MAAIPKDQAAAKASKDGHLWVSVKPTPNPIPYEDAFDLEVRLLDPKDKLTALEGASLDQVRATMPSHNHGMKVEPVIEATQTPGTFLVKGMRFHMQGDDQDGYWLLELVVRKQDIVDVASFDLQCCRPPAL